jgi:hypothetical protein
MSTGEFVVAFMSGGGFFLMLLTLLWVKVRKIDRRLHRLRDHFWYYTSETTMLQQNLQPEQHEIIAMRDRVREIYAEMERLIASRDRWFTTGSIVPSGGEFLGTMALHGPGWGPELCGPHYDPAIARDPMHVMSTGVLGTAPRTEESGPELGEYDPFARTRDERIEQLRAALTRSPVRSTGTDTGAEEDDFEVEGDSGESGTVGREA